MSSVHVIDSHTEGEPTRLVIDGGPDLTGLTVAEIRTELAKNHDGMRSAVVCEPRGSDAVVGALLCEPSDPSAQVGVVFFNNVGYLGMCGHGTIGLIATLAHMGRLAAGDIMVETPVGLVRATLHDDGRVSVFNIPSYRSAASLSVDVPGYGTVVGDVAYGGNWFFLTKDNGMETDLANLDALTRFSVALRNALTSKGIKGDDGGEIDHIEIFGAPKRADADSRNFVLCPGLAYDRSPCGTGLSAKLACLAADGKLAPGQVWRQESLIGSLFEGQFQVVGGCDPLPQGSPSGKGNHLRILPQITGRAFITAESKLIFDPEDPFRNGILP